jgi:hypothetical protein
VPALASTLLVLQCECKDGAALLDGILLLRGAFLQRIVDELKGLRGGKCWVDERHDVRCGRDVDERSDGCRCGCAGRTLRLRWWEVVEKLGGYVEVIYEPRALGVFL